MKKEMLINVLQPEECRIAIVEDGLLEELYVERSSQESYVGNIYKGRIVNIEPGIQAAFVDFGIGRNGFLHVSDVDPIYYKHLLPKDIQAQMDAEEDEERAANRRPQSERGRGRSERPERSEPPRYAEVESAVTLSGEVGDEDDAAIEFAPLPESETEESEVEEFEDDGFGAGIAEVATSEAATRIEVKPKLPPLLPIAPPPSPPIRRDVSEPDDEGDFGSGLLDDGDVIALQPAPKPRRAAAEEAIETPETIEPMDEEIEEKPKAKKPTRAKPKAKAEEPVVEDDAKKPAKPKRSRKKADDDSEDDKPKPLGAAEHRTSEDDDEPEIRPLFDTGVDFDIDAPNDRFGEGGEPAAAEAPRFEEAPADGEFDDALPTRRGFQDGDGEFEDGPPPPRDRGRGNDRGRGGPRRDDRGPRRDDRGPRRDDRGPRSGGGGGGDRGRPQGSGPGSRPPARDRGFPRPPIQEIFKRGQEVIIQVIKEAIGTKAPNLSTFISIAGRYLVLMPSLNRVGVSRKIEDMDARRRLREIMNRLNPPKGVGFIVRTAAIDRNENELQNDLAYLLRLWQVVARRIKRMPSPVEIYRESDMITRTIRDNFTADIDTIYVDEEHAFAQASEFLQIVMPRYADRIRFFSDTEPLFNKYHVEEEISKINQKRIELPHGGSIIIEQTEALVAIDVNSGNFRADNNAEETAYQLNLTAAKEIARQLRLRDLGGVIVNDFIDMRSETHRRKVEDTLRNALKRDRARTKILRISQFGIIEMTRQRIQPSLKKRIFNECSHCKGTGYVKTNETIGIEVMRLIQLAAHRTPLITEISITVHTDAAFHLLNRKRKEIAGIEERAKMEVQIHGVMSGSPEHLEFRCLDSNGNEVRLFGNPAPRVFRGPPRNDRDRRPPQLN